MRKSMLTNFRGCGWSPVSTVLLQSKQSTKPAGEADSEGPISDHHTIHSVDTAAGSAKLACGYTNKMLITDEYRAEHNGIPISLHADFTTKASVSRIRKSNFIVTT